MRFPNSSVLMVFAALVLMMSACDQGTIVEVVEVDRIELANSTEAVALGDDLQLDASSTSSTGEALDRALNWSSSSSGVATVSPTGRVTTVGAGTATITASADGASASTTVHVVDLPCDSNGTIRPGDAATGMLGTDCFFTSGVDQYGRDLAGRYADLWLLPVSTAGNVQLEMSSGFDTYLRVTDMAFELIDQNDDRSDTSTDSALNLALTPGVYIIQATTFDYDVQGSYQLSVSQ